MPKRELTKEEQALREHLGASIRAASAAKKIKPAAVAAAGCVSLATQYRIEAGELTPDILYLVKVAALLETSIDKLLADAASTPAPSLAVHGNNNVVAGRDVVGYVGGENRANESGGATQNFHGNVGSVAGRDVIQGRGRRRS